MSNCASDLPYNVKGEIQISSLLDLPLPIEAFELFEKGGGGAFGSGIVDSYWNLNLVEQQVILICCCSFVTLSRPIKAKRQDSKAPKELIISFAWWWSVIIIQSKWGSAIGGLQSIAIIGLYSPSERQHRIEYNTLIAIKSDWLRLV